MIYRANIEAALALATADEIRDGLAFYQEFRGVAVVLQRLYGLPSVAHGAGILAALSPMNDWHSNVADAFAVCRDNGELTRVRTTHPNRDKALLIRSGRHPEHVLTGRKVRAFYVCTLAPEAGFAVAVDRHLACAAAGEVLDDHGISRLLSRHYRQIEGAYLGLAAEHGILGHQLASVVWFAWRRMKARGTLGQLLIAA